MHVYLRDEPVDLRMQEVESEGLVPDGSDLLPMAFYVRGNEQPSFRALLPSDTIEVLREALEEPVVLGVLAEEPEDLAAEIHAMVGLAIPVGEEEAEEKEEPAAEPWRASVGDPEGWRGDDAPAADEPATPRTAHPPPAQVPLRLRRGARGPPGGRPLRGHPLRAGSQDRPHAGRSVAGA